MIRLLLALFTVCAACAGAEPKPLLVILQYGGGTRINAHDSPLLALYEDGTLICLHDERTSAEPFHVHKVADAAATAKKLLPFDFPKAKDGYDTTEITDQLFTEIWTPAKRITINGDWQRILRWKRNPGSAGWTKHEQEEVQYDVKIWETLPGEIKQALVRIDDQCRTKGGPWLPATIEMVLEPFSTKGKPVPWPKEWPGLHAKETREGSGRSYIVSFPADSLPALRSFVATTKGDEPVLIEGKRMLEYYRFPFPGEKAWIK